MTLNDLEEAARRLVEEEGNMGFEQHWADLEAQPGYRALLSTLAWATDERDRRQLDLDGIEEMLRSQRMGLERSILAAAVERLVEEEVLLRAAGPTYRFAVPLYRRWINWKYPPERVRAMG